MIKLQKSSLILILIIVVLTAGCVSIYTLGYTPGTVWHKAEDVKSGTFGSNVGSGNYNFPGNVGIKKTNPSSELDVTGNIYTTGQVTAGTKFKVGVSEITSGKLTGLDAPTNPSDAANKAYVDNHTNASCTLVGNDIICSGIPDNTGGTLSITKNGITCPIWKDCDGDGYTYGNGDCDESCNTCYVGNTNVYPSRDGKDNDCDGVVDDYDCGPIEEYGFDGACNWVVGGQYKYARAGDICEVSTDCGCCDRKLVAPYGSILARDAILGCSRSLWGTTYIECAWWEGCEEIYRYECVTPGYQ